MFPFTHYLRGEVVLKEHYLAWYRQFQNQLNAMRNVVLEKLGEKPRAVVISGMGGSGIVGDFYQVVASEKLDIPVFTVKDYALPKWVSKHDLVVTISYSGNTLETIECFKQALSIGAKVIAISSGGKLENLAKENNVPHVKVIKGLVPRASLPSMFVALSKSLNMVLGENVVKEEELEETIELLKDGVDEVEVKKIADHVENTLPIIIGCTKYAPLAIRFKNELNENSKIPAKVEIVPEWGHNDIVGWEQPYFRKFSALILREKKAKDRKCIAVLDYVTKYFEKSGVKTLTVEIEGESTVAQMLYGSLIAGLVSVELAYRRNIDPVETRSIREYKKYFTTLF